jgi:DNA-binding transcriptional MocR family regulator
MRTAQVNVPPGVIHFGVGQPGFDLLPIDLMQRAANLRLGQGSDPALLNYGMEQGGDYFRQALADFLSRGYDTAVAPDHLFTTNGISQALDMLCGLLTRPGDTIFVEEPTYFLALDIFHDRRLHVVPLPTDENGLVINALIDKLRTEKPVFLYTIPAFQNPSGTTLSLARRQELVRLSQEHGFYILADEVYQLLGFADDGAESGTAVPPPMAHISPGDTVISLGSFSKILAPGLRLGWLEAAPALLAQLAATGLLQSGGGLNPFTAEIVRSAIEQGWQDEFLARLKAIYRSRAVVLSQALHHYLSDFAQFDEPEGGFFIWVKLPQIADTAVLLEGLRPYQVAYHPGAKFSAQAGLRQYIRLSFAFYDEAMLVEGVRRLKTGLTALV